MTYNPNNSGPFAVSRLVTFQNEGAVKALCDLNIADTFLIKGLRIVEGKNGTFVSMPRQQGKNGKWYDTVHVLRKEAKEMLQQVLLEAYEKEKTQGSAS